MPPITGRMIQNFPLPREMFLSNFGTEIIYSFVIIVCSLMIYYGTRELYELSSHKGIKYFRQAFLFFALAYFFRSFIKLIVFYFNAQGILSISPRLFNPLISQITLIFFIYFSAMAVLYLLYSVMWKKWNGNDKKVYLFHLLAFAVSLFIVLSGNSLAYLGVNFLLFFIVLFVVYTSYKDKKKKTKSHKHNLYFIYLLLSFFWILNIIDILIPSFFQNFQLFIYLASSTIFFIMVYKVLKKVGSS
jgi:hypothetical protein